MILASPPDLAMWLSLLTAIAYAIPALVAERMGPSLAKRYLWLAWFLHGFTIGLGLLGETPRFGFILAKRFKSAPPFGCHCTGLWASPPMACLQRPSFMRPS